MLFVLPGMVAILRLIAFDTQQRGANLLGRVLFLAQVDQHLDVLERIVRQAAALVLERRDGRWKKGGKELENERRTEEMSKRNNAIQDGMTEPKMNSKMDSNE